MAREKVGYNVGLDYAFHTGKRVESIQKQWQQVFVEAAWHQPSVIVFDDLDQLVSAPSALQEMGGEALYKRRLAQGERSARQSVCHNILIHPFSVIRPFIHSSINVNHLVRSEGKLVLT